MTFGARRASTLVNGEAGVRGASFVAAGRDGMVQGREMPLPNKRMQLAGAAK